MNLDLNKTAFFTGHRPDKLGGYNENNPIATWVKAQLKEAISQAVLLGYDTFISGGAQATDQWAAEIVLEKGLRLIVARPFPSQKIKWPAAAQARFQKICDRAETVIDVSPDPYEVWKMQIRNEWMVDRALLGIAVWDGSAGGTRNCLMYAQRKRRRLCLINPRTRKILGVLKWEIKEEVV